MAYIGAQNLTDEALQDFDRMMEETAMKVDKLASLAVGIWADVLKELDRRGKVRLISGSYNDIGNARIQRLP